MELKNASFEKYDELKALRNKPVVPLYEVIYRALRHNIISGVYEAGERLTEDEVSKNAGVSRTPVREAFKRLSAEGLIDFMPNKGAVVTRINRDEISILWDIRIFVETEAVSLAAVKATDSDKQLLQSIIEQMQYEQQQNSTFFEDSVSALNNAILEIAEVRQLSRLYSNYGAFSWDMMRIVNKQDGDKESRDDPYINHIRIAQAVIDGNAELAAKITREHLTVWKNRFISYYFS